MEKFSAKRSLFPTMVQNRFVYTGEQLSEKWFQERVDKVTASRVGAFIKSKKSLVEKVKASTHVAPQLHAFAPQWGVRNETRALEAYLATLDTPPAVATESDGIFRRFGWFQASPDAILLRQNGDVSLVEIKCPSSRWPADKYKIPKEYLLQCAVQLFCTGAVYVDLVFWRHVLVDTPAEITDKFFGCGMELKVFRMHMNYPLNTFFQEYLIPRLYDIHTAYFVDPREDPEDYEWESFDDFDYFQFNEELVHFPNSFFVQKAPTLSDPK